MQDKRKQWSRDESIAVFNLYCRTCFGRMHKTNPDVIDMATKIGRTPSAVAMKMVNFASLDPFHRGRNVKGLQHSSKRDEQVWQEFHDDWEGLAFESQQSLARLLGKEDRDHELDIALLEPDIPTEARRVTRVRLVQSFFRDAVLSSYNYSCTVCHIQLCSMLNASHIVPWSIDEKRRADPSNGLSLCAFHDRAFDRGLITIDEDLRVVLSATARVKDAPKLHRVGLLEVEGQAISMPDKFSPDQSALSYHREKVFLH
ncbi:MAG: restriction endonuclease [Planctomycetes bacterium B3_Pla]|nr:MAG: restriction endonuclease [Planctomycetes bacterium B3_Pla]